MLRPGDLKPLHLMDEGNQTAERDFVGAWLMLICLLVTLCGGVPCGSADVRILFLTVQCGYYGRLQYNEQQCC